MSEDAVHLFGVRHHGPGCARSLVRALSELKPDAVLLEGPPDAHEAISLAASAAMVPPVALLVYATEHPRQAVFYPFALFSPEWQTIQFALRSEVPLRFIDLPIGHRLSECTGAGDIVKTEQANENGKPVIDPIRTDPIGCLAEAAGCSDGERWWDQVIEARRTGGADVFAAVADAMMALRSEVKSSDELEEQRREAYMRTALRAAIKEGYERIAVVCGAWHVPALTDVYARGLANADAGLLKGLPKTRTSVAWVPWSYDRLSSWSGYGAGVDSPEWYHLLWTRQEHVVTEWLARAARLLRDQDVDASSAQIIESVRLAETLGALRGQPLPGLPEADDAALAVLCFGEVARMSLIRRKLIIGERLGSVPEDAPTTPLQRDVAKLQSRLRMPPKLEDKDYDLDLRKSNDLERSHLLHRVRLLDIPWGDLRTEHGKKGTFHEFWRVQWKPEFVLGLIDAARFGNTIQDAATAMAGRRAETAAHLADLSALLDDALLADLPAAVGRLIEILQAKMAVSSDVLQWMSAVPPLGSACRYGSVRKSDANMVKGILDAVISRICVGLPGACSSLSDEAARNVVGHIDAVTSTLSLLHDEAHEIAWRDALVMLANHTGANGLIPGRAARLLHTAKHWPSDEVSRHLSLWTSQGTDPAIGAGWLEGFLSGSGLVLIHDERLWAIVDGWVSQLQADRFQSVLPLLRRTFSTFAAPERRKLGERVRIGIDMVPGSVSMTMKDFDHQRAEKVLPVLAQILGVEWPG